MTDLVHRYYSRPKIFEYRPEGAPVTMTGLVGIVACRTCMALVTLGADCGTHIQWHQAREETVIVVD